MEDKKVRARVYALLAEEPRTTYELCAVLGRAHASVHPRVSELRAMGCIEPTGLRRRHTKNTSAVWRVVPGHAPCSG